MGFPIAYSFKCKLLSVDTKLIVNFVPRQPIFQPHRILSSGRLYIVTCHLTMWIHSEKLVVGHTKNVLMQMAKTPAGCVILWEHYKIDGFGH
jgi:hypothetical protein